MHTSEVPKRSFVKKYHIKGIIVIAILIVLFLYSLKICGVDPSLFVSNIAQLGVLIGQMSNPDWSYFSFIWDPLVQTVQMAILGTTIGTIFAIPAAFLAARNLDHSMVVHGTSRFVLDIVRTLPSLLLAAILVAIFGIGPTTGTITLAIFSFGMISKLFYEVLETVDMGPAEAMKASGASIIQIIRLAIIPQIAGQFCSFFLYTLEVNVRSSTVLGYVGAGGLGLYLQQTIDEFNYSETAVVILATFATVLVIDILSNYLRRKLQ